MLVSRHLSGIVEVWIDMAPQTLESSWTGQGGLEHKVTTTRIDGESATDFANRHKEAVDALKAVFPPQE